MNEDDRRITVPANWYLGDHGDPVAMFDEDAIVLTLRADGTLTWQPVKSETS